jgi:hypothetical protein
MGKWEGRLRRSASNPTLSIDFLSRTPGGMNGPRTRNPSKLPLSRRSCVMCPTVRPSFCSAPCPGTTLRIFAPSHNPQERRVDSSPAGCTSHGPMVIAASEVQCEQMIDSAHDQKRLCRSASVRAYERATACQRDPRNLLPVHRPKDTTSPSNIVDRLPARLVGPLLAS